MSKVIRCAVYTRKSTEDGLEQEFNSLQAQREACEAYARSQSGNGWRISKTLYDDGGFSGGTMKRPALTQLMSDIEAGHIDLVLVYKIDRLTRSLADFARIVDMFDNRGVSFVSVTQQFNTASSMGRLTLNMLLSFAQFEREVTGERIRDKIAASKKKGMWMGGVVPIGYRNEEKKLIIDHKTSSDIKTIFEKYLELGTVQALKTWTDRQGMGTRPRAAPNTIAAFSRGHLYKILSNPIYKGMIAHKGQEFAGQHEAIIDTNTFDEVQLHLNANRVDRKTDANQPLGSLLTGKIKDEEKDRLVPVYTVKGGKRYRYYVSARTRCGPRNSVNGWRIPAKQLEDAVRKSMFFYINSSEGLIADLAAQSITPDQLSLAQEKIANLCEKEINQQAGRLIKAVRIKPGEVKILFDEKALAEILAMAYLEKLKSLSTVQSFTNKKRGVEQRLIFGNLKQSQVDVALLARVRSARGWIEGLSNGTYETIKDISDQTNLKPTDVSRYLPLAFLAPDIKQAIVEGTQPHSLTLESLKKIRPLPACWKEQRQALGF